MEVWECRQVVDFDQSTTTIKEEKKKNQAKYFTIYLVTFIRDNKLSMKWKAIKTYTGYISLV